MVGLMSWWKHRREQRALRRNFYRAWRVSLFSDDVDDKIAACTRVLDIARQLEPWPFSEFTRESVLGTMLGRRAPLYSSRRTGSAAESRQLSLADYNAALKFLTESSSPMEWALTHLNRGCIYGVLEYDRAENVETAIHSFEQSLSVFTPEADPEGWVVAQLNLGLAYSIRIRGVSADNFEKAIACCDAALASCDREVSPTNWASIQSIRASAYRNRIHGSESENIETAIKGFHAALQIYTRQDTPREWAQAQQNRANAYQHRILGRHGDNVETAISGYEAALQVFKPEFFPREWAQATISLANAFRKRNRGVPAENREKSARLYDAVLNAVSRDELPHLWAEAHAHRAHTFDNPINKDQAIAHFNAALEVFTRADVPKRWAMNMMGRANAYLARSSAGQIGLPSARVRAYDIEKAITDYDDALTVCTQSNFPRQWALLQMNRACAYQKRILGKKADNLAEAISGHRRALEVRTFDSDPDEYLRAIRLLGDALSAAENWADAVDAYASARRTANLMIGLGADSVESERVLEEVQQLGPAQALAIAKVGRPAEALACLEAGRARQLALGLTRTTARAALDLGDQVVFDTRLAVLQNAEAKLRAATEETRSEALSAVVAARSSFEEILQRGQAISSASELSLEDRLAILGRANITLAAPIFTDKSAILLIVPPGCAVEVVDMPDRSVDMTLELANREWAPGYNIILNPENIRNTFWGKWLATVEGIGAPLWNLFGHDLVAALDARGIASGSPLALLPQGTLGNLPLGLTQDPETGERLVERYELMLAPSLSVFVDKPHSSRLGLASIINPTRDPKLEAAEWEGTHVARHFGSDAIEQLEGSNATHAAVVKALVNKSHWHFACHGAFEQENARRSGLVLADGDRLTLSDLLESDFLTPPRLVFLSACETGLHDIVFNAEEFLGIPAGFFQQGAQAVIASQWPVDDVATALIVDRFFELHIAQGQRPSAALRSAQLWLRNLTGPHIEAFLAVSEANGTIRRSIRRATTPAHSQSEDNTQLQTVMEGKPFAHPYYWAGLAVYGM